MFLGPINVRATRKDIQLKVKEEYNSYKVFASIYFQKSRDKINLAFHCLFIPERIVCSFLHSKDVIKSLISRS